MAELVQIFDGRTGYREILDTVFEVGERVPSRNGDTIEVRDMVIELENPLDAVPAGVRPGFNVAIGAVEALQLVGGFSDVALTCEIQPNFRNFMDGTKFYGAYGLRTRDQFPVIFERLRSDPDTRQAIVTLWDPELDTVPGKKDYPCTTAFSFLVRNEALHMSTFMRSNDAWWGWPYDVWQFCTLQATLAQSLGYGVGTYTHHAASFHLYEPHWTAARETIDSGRTGAQIPTLAFGQWLRGGRTWESARRSAEDVWRVVTGTQDAGVLSDATERWYAETLMKRRLDVAGQNYKKLMGETR